MARDGAIVRTIRLGQRYPGPCALVEIQRDEPRESPGDLSLRWSAPNGYGPVLLVPAPLWDLLHSGLGMRQHTIKCRKCGKIEHTDEHGQVNERLEQLRFCFSCAHWLGRAKRAREPNSVIVDGRAYAFLPDPPSGYRGFVGFGGDRFDIEFFDGRRVISHNLWAQGEVPECWRAFLPDNATFTRSESCES